MILDENLFEEEKELPKKQPRYFAKEVDGKGYVYDRKFSTKVPSNVDKDIATARASVKRWNKEEPITEGKNLDDIVYDKLSRIKLSKGKDGKPRHPEVYANPKGNGFKLELDDEVGIDQAAKIAKEHGLNHNVKKVRDYIEVTIDTPERKAFTETYSKSSLEQEIRNKVRDTFPNFADDEYAEYIGDYLVVEIIPQDGRTKVEVRADLTYKMMDKIADNLNPIVQKLDKDAYFDHEDTGIINAFINSKDLKESAHKTKLAEWVSNFRKKSTKTESLMQDIQADHARIRDEYGQEVYDALEEYTTQGNDLGKVLYSEDGWKAFEEFCKGKGIEIVSKSKPFTAQVTESAEECRYTKEEIDKIKETTSRLEKELEEINGQLERIGTYSKPENSAMGRYYLKQKASIEERIANGKEAIDEYNSCAGVNESFEDEHLGTTESTPEPGPEAGIASLINKLIVDEWEAIQGYNDAIVAAETEGYSDIAQVLRDIANEENLHVGQLEQCMKTISPNAESIDQGEVEAEEQLNTTTETSEDPEEGMHY